MKRDQSLATLVSSSDIIWDVVVIGGGATGLGIALDAVTRGYKTLLLEQADFSKGTSSRSTKLVHGGVRYLAQGDILLVTEALHERGRMLRNAPHLTSNQEFIIPVYTIWDIILYTAGLKFYDILAGRLSLGKSYFINRQEALKRLPNLNPGKLKGGVVYHDGQFDDSRMALSLAAACEENGGTVLNYFRVTELLKDENGKINGVKARDMESGIDYPVHTNLVINATGIFADEIHKMDDLSSKPTIRPSQGVHIVLDNSFLQSQSAIMIPKTDDGRVLFAIPWYNRVVVGTTDTPLDEVSLEPRALSREVDFIINTARRYMAKQPSKDDILSVFAGLRPLAADPDNPASTKEVSRRHKISVSKSGLLSIIGGKWTSYRRMAEETIDAAIKAGLIRRGKCVTKNFSLYIPDGNLKTERLRIYGNRASEIEKAGREDPELNNMVHPDLPYTKAEIIWICRNEMPRRLEDLLARRTRALFLDVRASIEMAPVVASLMAKELGLNDDWVKDQVEQYIELAQKYL